MPPVIQSVQIPGQDIADIMKGIIASTQDYSDPALILGCFAVAATVSNPNLNKDKLNEIILSLSQHLVLLLSNLDETLTTN